jgi:hypothetical protein
LEIYILSLRKVQVSHRKLGTGDVDWKINLAPTTQILDIAITAMLGPACLIVSESPSCDSWTT